MSSFNPSSHPQPENVAAPTATEPTQRIHRRSAAHPRSQSEAARSRRILALVTVFGAISAIALLILMFLVLGGNNWINARLGNTDDQMLTSSNVAPGTDAAGSADDLSQIMQSQQVAAPGSLQDATFPVGSHFADYYNRNGGWRSFGLPLAAQTVVNGRRIQWFERARLEHWPEHAGTAYEIQPGLLGVEFTSGREFPRQEFFVSRPDLRYFPETGHAVGGAFLRYWENRGALRRFGLPISEEFDEMLADGNVYRVQYFQRARLEYHPEYAGTDNEVMIGLLGTALLQNQQRPEQIPPAPTAVPWP